MRKKTMVKSKAQPKTEAKKRGAERLKTLGAGTNAIPKRPSRSILETFDNSHPQREYEIMFECPEYTSICPITGQPDFGFITITYTADRYCLESKSLKLYLFSYRNHGAFHEEVVNMILDDCVAVCSPRRMRVRGEFNPRGGISISVTAEFDSCK